MRNVVLITGAGGFVGSAVVRLFVRSLRDGLLRFADAAPVEHVVALLRPGGSHERLEELPAGADWSIAHTDLADRAALSTLLVRTRPRAILHLAVDQAIHQDLPADEIYRLTIAPLETLFEGLRDIPGGRLIHTSSAWVLPNSERLDESVPLAPRMPYARIKAQMDELLPVLQAKTNVQWINLRLFYMFGKYESPGRLLPYLVSSLTQGKVATLTSATSIRDFSDVEDVARAFLLALRADQSACGQVYHIGSGRGISVRQFAMTVASSVGNRDLIRFDARRRQDQYLTCQVSDPSRALHSLGWSPDSNVETSITQVVEWWLNRWAAVETGVRHTVVRRSSSSSSVGEED
jgi:dolichol-phosphate mannosyltransferase